MVATWKTAVLALAASASAKPTHKPDNKPVAYPPPTGKYNVGAIKRVLPLYSENDPSAPGGIQSEHLVTVYYPTKEKKAKAAPVIDAELAKILEPYWQLTPGTMERMTAEIKWNATALAKKEKVNTYPTLLFGPGGYGPPTDCYVTLLTDLASHGWTVAALDHPWEQPFLRFPNGTGLVGVPTDFFPEAGVLPVLEARANDTIDAIQKLPSIAKEIGASWNTSAFAKFGHSLGGADAIQAIYQGAPLLSLINMDGSVWERANATDDGTHPADIGNVPSFLFGNGDHGLVEDGGLDVSWEIFSAQQTVEPYWLTVDGSVHVDFSDATFWKTVDEAYTRLGPIDGEQMIKIMRAYVRQWFEKTLLGKKAPLFEKPSKKYPEVTILDLEGLTVA